jgi:hypothetical protein
VTPACISEPISWLLLERFALGELAADPAARVERHLRDCPACAGCFGRIRAEAALALPELPAAAARPAGGRGAGRRRWPLLAMGASFAGAAAAALLLLAPPARDRRAVTASKGVEVALTLVRERQGAMAEDPAGYRPDDRWKALVTCPGGREIAWALLLFQEGEATGAVAAPVASGSGLACGNRVSLPGAFRLTGAGPLAVCFVALLDGQIRAPGAPPSSAADIAAMDQAGAACVRLSSESSPR